MALLNLRTGDTTPVPLTAHQTRLAKTIDTHVTQVLARGGGDEALLRSMADDMSTFTPLLGTCTAAPGNSRVARRRREDIARVRHPAECCLSTPCSLVVFLVLSWYGKDTF
jgi:hypothetical protein